MIEQDGGRKTMYLEYPEYYERFSCIAGDCEDSCCRGWEVDIDPESAAYYETVPGEFGNRLRKHIRKSEGECYFPLTEEGNCPFLNQQKLCDIYTAIGKESLCKVCTEYPRYEMYFGDYRQMDLNLSCMEVGRILFKETGKILYVRRETEEEAENVTEEEEDTLIETLAFRNEAIDLFQDRSAGHLDEKLDSILDAVTEFSGPWGEDDPRCETEAQLLKLLHSLEVIDSRWEKMLLELDILKDLDRAGRAFEDVCPEYDEWFSKLACYFSFRYFIDALIDGDLRRQLRLLFRSLRILRALSAVRFQEKKNFTAEDMIDIAHLFCREMEHSDENVEALKS